MIARLAERFPFMRVVFFDESNKMIDFMQSEDLGDVAVIALDHDLDLIAGAHGDWIDPGTGLDVAKWLAQRDEPICPVVVHTTNSPAGGKMMRVLKKSRWTAQRVIPCDDLRWIDEEWFRTVRNAIVAFAPRRQSTISAQAERPRER